MPFYGGSVTGAERDWLIAARIAAITRGYARGRALTSVEEAAALAEPAEVAHGRVDLLPQEAGLAIGFHGQDIDAPKYLQIAQLCIKAGGFLGEERLQPHRQCRRECPGVHSLIYPAAVTGAEKRGYTEAQASTAVRAIIDDFCPQWKVLLRQQG